MFHDVIRKIEDGFSGERAKELTAAIHGFDRWSTFSQYRKCGNYCATRMREYGLEDIELMDIVADGETKYGDWIMPLAWDVDDARLEIIEPREAARVLAIYQEEPACLAMWSAPTPEGGVEAEVVLVEDGRNDEDYEGVDVEGKIIFTSQQAGRVRRQAVKRGAIGVISDHPSRWKEGLEEAVCWVNAWVDYQGWGFLKLDTPIFGFSLPREEGEYLRKLIQREDRVRVRAHVDSWLFEGSFTLPTGVIKGQEKPEEEVLVYAHSYEYGAQDNASGCALVLESARCLNKLIAEGKLSRPRRSIRFMMSWECYGSIPWAVERIYGKGNVVAGLCLDSLGGKQNLTGAGFYICQNLHAQASFTDFLTEELAQGYLPKDDPSFKWELGPYRGGTDHTIFLDPAFDVPMPWMGETPSKFHHCSLDTMDKIDAANLQVEGILSATYLYFLADAGPEETLWLAEGTARQWEKKITKAADDFLEELSAEERKGKDLAASWKAAREKVEYLRDIGAMATRSALRLMEGESRGIEQLVEELEEKAAKSIRRMGEAAGALGLSLPPAEPLSEEERRAEQLVPRRLVPGVLTLCDLPEEKRAEYERIAKEHTPMWSPVLNAALFWADGKRSLHEIKRLVEQELGPMEVELVKYFELLEGLGYIEFQGGSKG